MFAMSDRSSVSVSVAIAFGGLLLLHNGDLISVSAAQPATTQASTQGGIAFANLTSAQLATMLKKKDFFFVNVHIPYAGEIKNTDAFIAFDKIAVSLDKLPAEKSARIVLYCQSGRMSEIAARELTRLGYSQVSHLSGGMVDWERSGYEIIRK
jgi:rhodanese-related sulfurtransferase